MTKTVVFKDIGQTPVVVGDSATHNTVTVQVRGTEAVEIVVDDRDETTRQAAGDDQGIVYKPGEISQHSGFDGEVRVNRLSEVLGKTAVVVVTRS
ncbi:MAG: hypothetical protein K6L74_17395 [Neptuniibacter sp.]